MDKTDKIWMRIGVISLIAAGLLIIWTGIKIFG